MRRAAGLCLALILAVALAYVSRFWVVELWGREGLFGVGEVRAGGDLWRGWMRGIGLGAFDAPGAEDFTGEVDVIPIGCPEQAWAHVTDA